MTACVIGDDRLLTKWPGPAFGYSQPEFDHSDGKQFMALELTVADVQAGDVLMCFSSMTFKEAQAAGTGYSHTAIALPEQRALEASNEGVRIISMARLLDDYDHIAVLGDNGLWNQARLDSLEDFAALASGKKFNQTGLQRVPERRERYQNDLMERVKGYFEGTGREVASERGVYFCSELTTAAFIHVGIIDQSAAVIFTPETIAPSDIAMDKVFGFFRGYVKSSPEYAIPYTDHFQHSV